MKRRKTRRLRIAAVLTVACVLGFVSAPAWILWFEWSSWSAPLVSFFNLEERQGVLFVRSLFVAAVSTALALIWGSLSGFAVARTRGTGGAVLEVSCYLPLLLPNVVLALGWSRLLGAGSPADRALASIFGSRGVFDLHTPLGTAVVLSFCTFPFATACVSQGVRSMRESRMRAAALVAGRWKRFWRLWIPSLAPHLATSGLVIFLVSFSDYGVPSTLMVNVFPVEIFAQLSSFHDTVGAARLARVVLDLAILLCILRYVLFRVDPRGFETERAADSPVCGRRLLVAVAAVITVSTFLPLAALIAVAGGWDSYVLAMKTAGEQILCSLRVAGWSAVLMIGLAGSFAAACRFLGRTGRIVAEGLAVCLLVVPGSIVGLGWIQLLGWGPLSALRDHDLAVALAASSRYLTIPALILGAAVVLVSTRSLQAARVAGAGRGRILRSIVLPLLVPGVLAAATFAFVLALGELSAAVLVYPPGGMPLAVRLASLLHFGDESMVAALCVMTSAFVVGLFVWVRLILDHPLRLELHGGNRG